MNGNLRGSRFRVVCFHEPAILAEFESVKAEADMAVRQICVSVGASMGTVQSWLSKTRQAHLGWQLALQMSDEELAALIYGDEGRGYRQPDWQWIHQELKIKGVTRQLLYKEYRAQGGKCYHYSRFCDLYSNWLKRQKRSMRQVHKGGRKSFRGLQWQDSIGV